MTSFHPILLDVWREACRHIQIDESTDLIFELIAEPLAPAALAVYRWDESRGDFHLAASAGEMHSAYPGTITVSEDKQPEVESWVHGSRFVLTREMTWASKGLSVAAGRHALQHEYAAPLAVEGHRVGLLSIRFPNPDSDAFEDRLEKAALLLEPFAVAVANDTRLREIQVLQEAAEAERSTLLQKLGMRQFRQEIVGAGSGLSEVLGRVQLVARTDTPVLIFGETGTGKEVIAREIHNQSDRANGPFIRVNCGAIPAGLIDSELFGHERGSFTGAHKTRTGWFERADGGTLFLDEVGELPSEAQVRLLRVLQDGHLERVGGHHEVGVDVRVVAATHRPLAEMVETGRFRDDLWYRIAVFPVEIPPLRDRREDVPELTRHFAERAARRFGLSLQLPDTDGLAALVSYDWPGNIRELAAVIDRAAILGDGRSLQIRAALGMARTRPSAATPKVATGIPASSDESHNGGAGCRPSDAIPAPAAVTSGGRGREMRGTELREDEGSREDDSRRFPSLDEAVSRHIQEALHQAAGKVEGPGGAAELLGVNPSTLRSRMRKLGLL